ncbi:MAG: hypothetical protein JOZ62_06740 [Acidobacteriaceae bacterium]|nr:hypothetical protein [Acidobacteriaceae bacterium]
MAVEFRYARAEEYPAISKFVNDNWAENHIYVRARALFEWTFQRPGYWQDGGASIAIAEENSQLVGILGGIPFTLNHFGQLSNAVWIVNYIVREDYRKGTTALRLLSQFRKPRFDSTIAFGINPSTSAIYRVLRGEVVDKMPRHILFVPGTDARVQRMLTLLGPEWTSDSTRSLAATFETANRVRQSGTVGREIPKHWDEHDWPEWANRTIGAVRDSNYLRWRYIDHPAFRYRILTIRDGWRTGLLVWRLEKIQARTEAGRQEIERFGRVVEFLPASPANAEELVSALIRELNEACAMGADFYTFHGEIRRLLTDCGFRDADLHPQGTLFPGRFQPLDTKGGGIMSAMFLPPDLPKCCSEPGCPWYWTKSDSDQDRPN